MPFTVDERAVNDYYPFGMLVKERSWSSSDYRYGYNGQEKSLEIDANGNHNTAEFWEYDARSGRRWNLDPVVKPWQSGYSTFADNPIYYNDISGDEEGGTTTGGKPNMDGGSAPNTKPKEGDARTNPNTGTEYKFQGGVWTAQGNAVEIPANNNKILDASIDVGKKLGIFLSGAVTAIITDNSPIASNFSSFNFGLSEENAYYFNAGTTFGHASALVGGLFEAGSGIVEDFVGGAAVPVTAGLSGGLVLAGSLQIIHGGATASKAWLNLINSNNVFSKAQESGGDGNNGNVKLLNDSYLKSKGIDAHKLKKDILGKKAKIALYDLYQDNKTGEILMFLKKGKGNAIHTGEFIK